MPNQCKTSANGYYPKQTTQKHLFLQIGSGDWSINAAELQHSQQVKVNTVQRNLVEVITYQSEKYFVPFFIKNDEPTHLNMTWKG